MSIYNGIEMGLAISVFLWGVIAFIINNQRKKHKENQREISDMKDKVLIVSTKLDALENEYHSDMKDIKRDIHYIRQHLLDKGGRNG